LPSYTVEEGIKIEGEGERMKLKRSKAGLRSET